MKTKSKSIFGRSVASFLFFPTFLFFAIERRFSVNKQLLFENLQQKSLVSQQILYDHINSNKIKVQECDLSSEKMWKLVDKEPTLMKRKKEGKINCINALKKDAEKMYIKVEFRPPDESKLLQKTVEK